MKFIPKCSVHKNQEMLSSLTMYYVICVDQTDVNTLYYTNLCIRIWCLTHILCTTKLFAIKKKTSMLEWAKGPSTHLDRWCKWQTASVLFLSEFFRFGISHQTLFRLCDFEWATPISAGKFKSFFIETDGWRVLKKS